MNRLSLSLSPIQQQLDLIDEILRANRTDRDLRRARRLGQEDKAGYSMDNGLLKKQGKLVVAKSVRTDLITASHCSLVTAHPRKNKTKALIKEPILLARNRQRYRPVCQQLPCLPQVKGAKRQDSWITTPTANTRPPLAAHLNGF